MNLYIIGGASRSGKSILARKLLAEKGVSYFSLDYLGRPLKIARGEDPDPPRHKRKLEEKEKDFIEHARNNWPVVRGLIENIVLHGEDYCIEGETFLPQFLATLEKELQAYIDRRRSRPTFRGELSIDKINVHSCLLGYAHADTETKVHDTQKYQASPFNWMRNMEETELTANIEKRIKFSEYLSSEAKKYDTVAYVDTSYEFEDAIEEAFSALTRKD